MFGRVVQVILKRGNEQKMFSFNERNQDSGGETARIGFYTKKDSLRNAPAAANIDLYNLDDMVKNWIFAGATSFTAEENPTLTSNLDIELWVGYSDFQDTLHRENTTNKDGTKIKKNMWNIFSGTVNSYYNSRKGRDVITHLLCGYFPANKKKKTLFKRPLTFEPGTTRAAIIDYAFENVLIENNIIGVGNLILPGSSGLHYKSLLEMATGRMRGDYRIKIRDKYALQPDAPQIGLSLTGTTSTADLGLTLNKKPESEKKFETWLREPCTAYPTVFVDNFEDWLRYFCLLNGAIYVGYNPIASSSSLFVCDISLVQDMRNNSINELNKKAVSWSIKNYEMLIEEPTLTSQGVEIKSLMRPWADVEDVIMLSVDSQPVINGIVRNDNVWTANIQGADNLYLAAWGGDTATFAIEHESKVKKCSFLNKKLRVVGVQHIGDTHKKDWYSQITTLAPGTLIEEAKLANK